LVFGEISPVLFLLQRRIAVTAQVQTHSTTTSRTRQLVAAAMAAAFGMFLILGVGFAQSDTLHNAAHDSRHSFSFACH